MTNTIQPFMVTLLAAPALLAANPAMAEQPSLIHVAQTASGQSVYRAAGYDKVMACAGRVHGISLASKDPAMKSAGQSVVQLLVTEAKALKPEKTEREMKAELTVAANAFLGAAIQQDRAAQSQIESACKAIGVG